jgi:hypothetical protein
MQKVVFLGWTFNNACLVFAKEGKDKKCKDREVCPAFTNLTYRESYQDYYNNNPKILKSYDRLGKVLTRS